MKGHEGFKKKHFSIPFNKNVKWSTSKIVVTTTINAPYILFTKISLNYHRHFNKIGKKNFPTLIVFLDASQTLHFW
jgi:hypothetical protein